MPLIKRSENLWIKSCIFIFIFFMAVPVVSSFAQTSDPVIYSCHCNQFPNPINGELIKIDAKTLKQIDSITISNDFCPNTIALSSDEKLAFVGASPTSGSVFFIVDLISKTVIKQLRTPGSVHDTRLGPDGLVYVQLDSGLYTINPNTLELENLFPIPPSTLFVTSISFSPDKRLLYLIVSEGILGQVDQMVEIDILKKSINRIRKIPFKLNGYTESFNDGDFLYVPVTKLIFPTDPASFDTETKGYINVVNLINLAIDNILPTGKIPNELLQSANQQDFYVLTASGELNFVNIASKKKTIVIPDMKKRAYFLSATKNKKYLFLTTDHGQLFVVDTTTNSVVNVFQYASTDTETNQFVLAGDFSTIQY
jgi:WD40 repeat protein